MDGGEELDELGGAHGAVPRRVRVVAERHLGREARCAGHVGLKRLVLLLQGAVTRPRGGMHCEPRSARVVWGWVRHEEGELVDAHAAGELVLDRHADLRVLHRRRGHRVVRLAAGRRRLH